MFNWPQETVRDNKSSSYSVFQLPGVNCKSPPIMNSEKLSINHILKKDKD